MKSNAQTLAQTLLSNGVDIVSGGTDTHLVLLNLKKLGLTGQQAQDALADLNLTSNKNPIPFDSVKPSQWVGLRLGVAAATTRGLDEDDMKLLGELISESLNEQHTFGEVRHLAEKRGRVSALCERYPIYQTS